ncbi:hypothetical protein CI102_10300 [Trichoderma harzianum]|uniref:TLC domain-containing protein n=1 Tax=Trichoderma harzianum CBS 226.95 TaxID=983964 RepID=A0A2T4AAM6_TRIHA|nr:hypothetical protein M431DRAFT_451112 [Trichoderma harzianum CBS 226.95]PKK45067.1 hypothetical protein CI102_10300 [Trichoderma harzianum]PTB54140.1 hypothetical protein M431DRAFT_451112 [Trichoderma harzianum CBS 226.95]
MDNSLVLLVHHITLVGSLAVTLTTPCSLQALFRFITGTLFPYSRTMEARPLISLSEAALFNVSGRAGGLLVTAQWLATCLARPHWSIGSSTCVLLTGSDMLQSWVGRPYPQCLSLPLYRTWSIFAEALAWRLRL